MCGEKGTLITKYLELIKRRSKVEEKNTSCERALHFEQWKIFFRIYKPMTVWFWLVYKFRENYCPSWLFSKFIQTFLTKYPSLKTTYHIKLKFFLCSKPLDNLLLAKCLISVNAPLLENFIFLQWWLRLCPWFCSVWFYLT